MAKSVFLALLLTPVLATAACAQTVGNPSAMPTPASLFEPYGINSPGGSMSPSMMESPYTHHFRFGNSTGIGSSNSQTTSATVESFAPRRLRWTAPQQLSDVTTLDYRFKPEATPTFSERLSSPALKSTWTTLSPEANFSSLQFRPVPVMQFAPADVWGDIKHFGSVQAEPSSFLRMQTGILGGSW